ncbi:hypothetical protein GCM10008986_10370 [Salinibacillus aidingensis]|uniref:Uncharacterized protein n=1 Tax=Salinibacillus aidingensis TaxID=237684 RepID=A0ABP3KWU5_9BACI
MYLTNVRVVDKLRIESMITVYKRLNIIIFLVDEQSYFTKNVGMFVKMKTAVNGFMKIIRLWSVIIGSLYSLTRR